MDTHRGEEALLCFRPYLSTCEQRIEDVVEPFKFQCGYIARAAMLAIRVERRLGCDILIGEDEVPYLISNLTWECEQSKHVKMIVLQSVRSLVKSMSDSEDVYLQAVSRRCDGQVEID